MRYRSGYFCVKLLETPRVNAQVFYCEISNNEPVFIALTKLLLPCSC